MIFINTARALYESLRPGSTFVGAFGASVSLLATASDASIAVHVLVFMVVSLAMAGGFYFNDLYDIEKDRINAPERPLAAGRISGKQIRLAGGLAFFSAMTLSVFLGLLPALLVAINCFLLWAYSPLRMWDGFAGNLVTAYFGASLVVLGGLIGTWNSGLFSAAIFAFGILLLREFIFDIRDVQGDQSVGLKTLATRLGTERVFRVVYTSGASLAAFLVFSAFTGRVGHPVVFLVFTLAGLAMTLVPLRNFQRDPSTPRYDRFYILSKLGLLLSMPGLVAGALA